MARDKIHKIVVIALEKNGCEITDDPLIIELKDDAKSIEIDLAGTKAVGADRSNEKIAVEIKSFLSTSLFPDFYSSLGQYLSYRYILEYQAIERTLYLGVSLKAFYRIRKISTFIKIWKYYDVKIVIINLQKQTVEKWIE